MVVDAAVAVAVEVDTPTSTAAVTVEVPVDPTKEEARDTVPDLSPRDQKGTPITGPHPETDRVIDLKATWDSRPGSRSMTVRGRATDPLHGVVETG